MNVHVPPSTSSRGEPCPSENDLADFAARAIDAEHRARVEQHLDACHACRRLVAELVASRTNDASPVEEPPPGGLLAPGATLGRYVVQSFLGRGGMAAVYRAHDPVLLRDVALKVIDVGSARAGDVRRWVREARAVASLEHPNVVSLYDVGETEGTAFLAMELVAGEPLRALVGKEGVPLSSRLAWLVAIARALDAAHARGLVHRDVKPENVIVGAEGACKVLDFGLARRTDAEKRPSGETITREGVVVGTPLYMAPEQLRGEALDGRADQFAWGVVAYELLSGRRPWASKERGIALVSAILVKEAASLDDVVPGVSPEVAAVVARALQKEPSARFASMRELLTALEKAGVVHHRDERSDGALAPAVLALGTSGTPERAPVTARRVAVRTAVLALVLGVAASTIVGRAGRFAPEPVAIAKAATSIAASSAPPPASSALVPSDTPPIARGALGDSPAASLRPLPRPLPRPAARREGPPATLGSSHTNGPAPRLASGANGAPILEPE